jgi:hypothetical protein
MREKLGKIKCSVSTLKRAISEKGCEGLKISYFLRMLLCLTSLRLLTVTYKHRFDVIDLIRKHAAAQAAEAAGAAPGDGLAIAGANGSSSAHVQKFSVEIVQDMDNEARRIEKESEANAKRCAFLVINEFHYIKPLLSRRQQNALPEWHIFSTVTGERTAFGNVIEAGTSGANGALNPALQPGASNKDSKLDIKPKRDENAECEFIHLINLPFASFMPEQFF